MTTEATKYCRELEVHLAALEILVRTTNGPIASVLLARRILNDAFVADGVTPDPELPPIDDDYTAGDSGAEMIQRAESLLKNQP